MDWNFKDNRHSKVKSVASLYPMFVKLADDVKGEKQLLEDLTLEYGVACSVKDNYHFPLQWDYPNVWAPLQFMAYTACKNYGLNEKANDIARRYINLIETNFEKTGNLWEKYDGNTGKVANQDYNAPTMMGWTAGVYLRFKYDLKEI
jgi:alpha,alpha-trehalase